MRPRLSRPTVDLHWFLWRVVNKKECRRPRKRAKESKEESREHAREVQGEHQESHEESRGILRSAEECKE